MLRKFTDIKNFSLAASDGEIGKVKELYFNDQGWRVRYLVVETGGWLRGRSVLIAPRSLGVVDKKTGLVVVHLTKEQVENSPPIEADKPLSRQYEEAWHKHYGYPGYWLAPEAIAFGAMPTVPETAVVRAETKSELRAGDPHLRSTGEVLGYSIHARDGDIGHLDDLVIDDEAWIIRYISISKSWWPGKRVVLSAGWIEAISWKEGQVFVSVARETIKDAPEWDGSAPMSRDFEEKLHDYYGRHGYWPAVTLA